MLFGTAEVSIAPTTTAVSLDDIKIHLGLTTDSQDTEVLHLVDAATDLLERMTEATFRETTFELALPMFPSDCIELPKPPLSSVTSVEYYDVDGDNQTWDAANYYVVRRERIPSIIAPILGETWPSTRPNRIDAVRVTFVSGYGAGAVPQLAQTFIKEVVRHWYDNPSAVVTGTIATELPFTVTSIARSLKTGFYADADV